ncbi:hypothetical protein [Alteromonas flava]|uniref:hypothetical protein n=1 Tax=Alteromonas flava TaxID=2048003 RepID=UPI000C287059|nr:hypothetical protein [Alteromonas flava]
MINDFNYYTCKVHSANGKVTMTIAGDENLRVTADSLEECEFYMSEKLMALKGDFSPYFEYEQDLEDLRVKDHFHKPLIKCVPIEGAHLLETADRYYTEGVCKTCGKTKGVRNGRYLSYKAQLPNCDILATSRWGPGLVLSVANVCVVSSRLASILKGYDWFDFTPVINSGKKEMYEVRDKRFIEPVQPILVDGAAEFFGEEHIKKCEVCGFHWEDYFNGKFFTEILPKEILINHELDALIINGTLYITKKLHDEIKVKFSLVGVEFQKQPFYQLSRGFL